MILADDAATAGRELEAALERVSQRVVAEQLCVLDNSLGLSVSRLVLTKFNLLRARAGETSPEVVTESEPEFSVPDAVPDAVPIGPLALAAAVGDDLSLNPER
jgi:hypothetical protein